MATPYPFTSYTQLSPRLTLFSFPPRVSQQHAGIHGTQHVFQLAMCLCFTPRPSAYTSYLPLACIRLQYWIVEAKIRAKVNGIMALQGNSIDGQKRGQFSSELPRFNTPSLVPLTITNGSLLPACNFFPFLLPVTPQSGPSQKHQPCSGQSAPPCLQPPATFS